jgi:hypothetical protein
MNGGSPTVSDTIADAPLLASQIDVQAGYPRALEVRLDAAAGRFCVELSNGCSIGFPTWLVQTRIAPDPPTLSGVEIVEDGRAFAWAALGAHLSVMSVLAWVSSGGPSTGSIPKPGEFSSDALQRRLQLIERRILQIEADALSDEPAVVTEQTNMMRATLSQLELPVDALAIFKARLEKIELESYLKHLSFNLEAAIEAARSGEQNIKEKNLQSAKKLFFEAAKLGIKDEMKERVKRKLDIIFGTTITGNSAKAKQLNINDMFDRPVAPEQLLRRYNRFSTPRLVVVIGAQRYFTIDWSLGGALLDRFPYDLFPDTQIALLISVEGDDFQHHGVGRVVHVDAKRQTLSLKYDAGPSMLLPIMDRCRKLGVPPRE